MDQRREGIGCQVYQGLWGAVCAIEAGFRVALRGVQQKPPGVD